MTLRSRLVRAAVAALLIMVMAVTPLSAFLSGGHFEVRLPGSSLGSNPFVRVLLEDNTGFVREMSVAPAGRWETISNPVADRMALVVTWLGGCGDRVAHLTFVRTGDRFLLTQRTDESGCSFLIGYSRSVAIVLWSPIDAIDVDFDPQLSVAD